MVDIMIGEWVNVYSGTCWPAKSQITGHKTIVVVVASVVVSVCVIGCPRNNCTLWGKLM